MAQYIDKAALVAEIERVLNSYDPNEITSGRYALADLRDFINTLEVKESEDERIRKALVRFHKSTIDVDGIKGEDIVAWLEKQSGCFAMWKKNIIDNKPTLNHSVLMKSIHGMAEGEWNGKEWIQYKWSCKVKDSDVLYWMDLHELEK